ncbi:MAG: hypothetical protein LBD75_01715 [Candidatus Peribacteria bacterium]|jgi:hypothetical protein|nr:hypothetical protein [Candidatus Peribacteria bacterium]
MMIDDLFFTGTENLQYRFHATDHYGNTTTQDIILNITIPEITITNIEQETETAATITAELSSDVDEGTITFQRQRNNLWTNLLASPTPLSSSNTQTTETKIENYPLQPNLTTIQGKYYNLNEKI